MKTKLMKAAKAASDAAGGGEGAAWPAPKDTYVLLWNPASSLPHIEPAQSTVEAGWNFLAQGMTNGWTMLAIGSFELVTEAAEAIRPLLAGRYNAKHQHETGFIPFEELP